MEHAVPDDDIKTGVPDQIIAIHQIRAPGCVRTDFDVTRQESIQPEKISVIWCQNQKAQLSGPHGFQWQCHLAGSIYA